MIDIIAYLLPMSGDMLLAELLDHQQINIRRAVLPEEFASDCESAMRTLDKADIPYTIPTNLDGEIFHEWVDEDSYDVGVSVGYDKKLPGWLIDTPEHGTINIHPSDLPRYRGANPYFWVIRNREETTGVTLHYMDEEFDTGSIIRRESIDLNPDETMGSLFLVLNRIGIQMMVQTLEQLQQTGTAPESEPQKDGEFPTAPGVDDNHLRIDWGEPRKDVEALVRAGNPFFGAYTTFRGATVRIYEVAEAQPDSEVDEDPEPGSVLTDPDGPLVRCADGWLRLRVVQLEQQYKASGREFQRRERTAFEVLDRMI